MERLEDRCVPAVTAVDDAFPLLGKPEGILDVLRNDSISDGSGLRIASVSAVGPNAPGSNAGPTVVVNADGTLTFSHATPGDYTFSYSAEGVQYRLTPEGAGSPVDRFGQSVAVSGDTLVIGAPGQDVGLNRDQGVVWVFVRDGTVWTEQARLLAPFGTTADGFGWSVAISGDTLVAGSIGHEVAGNSGQGSASVFVRSGTTWTFQAELLASDGSTGDAFGNSVAISGDAVVVGALFDGVGGNFMQGSAYVFARSGTTWDEQAHLIASDGAAMDTFGNEVGISGDTVVVGAFQDEVAGNTHQGSAYVFARSGTTWSEQAHLTASDGELGDEFGTGVGVSGDTIVIGAPTDDVGGNVNQGSAYVFVRGGSTWSEQAHLFASDGSASDAFGESVAIAGERLIGGARLDVVGTDLGQGSAYVFERGGVAWTQTRHLTAARPANQTANPPPGFGSAVAISGETAVIGAPGETVGVGLGGAVYAQNISPPAFADVQVIVVAWPEDTVLNTEASRNLFQPAGTDAVDAQVASWYRAILGREPDAPGLENWSNLLRNGADSQAVVDGIWFSLEHRRQQVESYYQRFLHRVGDESGLASWSVAMVGGLDETAVVRGFLLSQEYSAINPSNAAFLVALYQEVLRRQATDAEIASWDEQLVAGAGRDVPVDGMLDSLEKRIRSLDSVYYSFLLRLPDQAGVSNWLAALDSGKSDLGDVARAVLASTEFASYAGRGP